MKKGTPRAATAACLAILVFSWTALRAAPATTSAPRPDEQALPQAFAAGFDGNPAAPQPWRPPDWDVTVHSRDAQTWTALEPVDAHHGADCSAPPATHRTTSYEGTVFLCRDHLMTAISASGYGLIYLTPPVMADFSAGESVIRFDMSTLRTSPRDWVDLWITPYEDNLQFALDEWLPDGNGLPAGGCASGWTTALRAASSGSS
jgi:hypothetical protein